MQILVGTSNDSQKLDAQRWICHVCRRAFLDELEIWIKSKESTWGSCRVFVEIVLPEAAGRNWPHNQIDLLICFADRVAHCELKAFHSYDNSSLNKLRGQVDGQRDWLKRLLMRGGFNPDRLTSFLFVPRLNTHDVGTLAADLIGIHADQHIAVTSPDPALKGERDSRLRSFYLIEGLQEQLDWLSPPTVRRGITLDQFVYETLIKRGSKLRPFASFCEARTWLLNVIPFCPDLPLQHVPALRKIEMSQAQATLEQTGVVEVVGSPGIGKSTFVKELVRAVGLAPHELRIRNCRSLHDLCCTLNGEVRGEFEDVRGEETLIQQLTSERNIFWINYDEHSRAPLEQLFDQIRRITGASRKLRSLWIIESSRPLNGLEGNRCELGPLSKPFINKILARVEPGNAKNDAELIAHSANGNPRRALQLWRSKDSTDEGSSSEFDWFCRQLSREQARVLPLVCLAASKSPFGITLKGLAPWCQATCADLPSDHLHHVLESLLERMVDLQVARAIRLDRETFGGQLDDILPARDSMTAITDISSNFVESGLSSMTRQKLQECTSTFCSFLNKKAVEPYSSTFVTLGLSLGDLEPFFRSSFRFTHLKKFLMWVDGTQWRGESDRQTFLLRAIRLLMRLAQHPSADVENEITGANLDDEAQAFAFDVVKKRSFLAKNLDSNFDLKSWLREIAQYRGGALQTELYVSTIMTLQHGRRPEKAKETWNILEALLEDTRLEAAERCAVAYQTLAFLNRKNLSNTVMHSERARELSNVLSRELLEFGLKSENLHLLCDVLFYWVRSQAFRKGASPGGVFGYTAALRFVEEGQTRPVRSLQVLLTQGSIRLHFCDVQTNISWVEFEQNWEDGLESYRRASRSALTLGHILHALNASSYMMGFCLKALRFAGIQEARSLISERAIEAFSCADKTERQSVSRDLGKEEQDVLMTIRQSRAILTYAIAIVEPKVISEEELRDVFAKYVTELVREIDVGWTEGRRKFKRRQQIDGALKQLHRAMNLGEMQDADRRLGLMTSLRPEFELLLGKTRQLFANSSEGSFPGWSRVYTLFTQVVRMTHSTSDQPSRN